MAKPPRGAALRHVHTLFNVGTVGGLTDGQLLEWYTTRGGEATELAFAALVERHGPMVLRVCRAVLRDEHAAQDAFQATFLVLVRRAGSLWVATRWAPGFTRWPFGSRAAPAPPQPGGGCTNGRRPRWPRNP